MFVFHLWKVRVQVEILLVECECVEVAEFMISLLYKFILCLFLFFLCEVVLLFEDIWYSLDSDHSTGFSQLA